MRQAEIRKIVREELIKEARDFPHLREYRKGVASMQLNHATTKDAVPGIKKNGLTSDFNYFAPEGGSWADREMPVVVTVDGSAVADSAYPDPEHVWVDVFPDASTPVHMKSIIDDYGGERAVAAKYDEWMGTNPYGASSPKDLADMLQIVVTRPVSANAITNIENVY